jgi:membrane-associated protease RseP (regulator of RpoE activity)
MIRTLLAALLLASVGMATSSAAGGQPEPQPQQGTNPAPAPRAYIAGRSYLGVDIRDITQDRVAPLKLKEERGVEITMVDQDAPAGKAGLHEHDVILDFNGTPVESEEELRRLIRETPPGRTVSLGISRDGNPMKVTVQLADHSKLVAHNRTMVIPPMPELPDFPNRIDVPGNIYVMRSSTALLGIQTENLTKQLGDFFGVKNGEGVLIRNVEKGGPAEKAGLKAGDVIVRVGDEKLSDRSDFGRVMRNHRSGGKLSLGIIRDKREQTFTVDLPERGARDSSKIEFDFDGFDDAFIDLSELSSMVPELRDSTRQLAELNLDRELKQAMQQYRGEMKNYKDQFKTLQKQLEKQQKDFDKFFHPML